MPANVVGAQDQRASLPEARTHLLGPLSSIFPLEVNLNKGNACLKAGEFRISASACRRDHGRPRRQQTLVPAALALAFPEHADAPACGARMLYSHHSSTATRNNSQLLPKGIFSCIIYLNTCLRLQGRVRNLSSGGRSGTGRSGPFPLEDSRGETRARWSKAWLGSQNCITNNTRLSQMLEIVKC